MTRPLIALAAVLGMTIGTVAQAAIDPVPQRYALTDAAVSVEVPAGWIVREATPDMLKFHSPDGRTRVEFGLIPDEELRHGTPNDAIAVARRVYSPYLVEYREHVLLLNDGLNGLAIGGYAPFDEQEFLFAAIGAPGGVVGLDLRAPRSSNETGLPTAALAILGTIRCLDGCLDNGKPPQERRSPAEAEYTLDRYWCSAECGCSGMTINDEASK